MVINILVYYIGFGIAVLVIMSYIKNNDGQ